MAQTVSLAAEVRTPGRKKGAKALRNAGRVPAILYGHGTEPRPLSVSGAEFTLLLGRIAPETTIVDVTVDGQTVKALIREVQRHPVRPGVVHVDFQEIHAGEKIRLEIPIHITGIADGVRNQGGTLDQVLRTIEIEVLPADIPERVELDVTALVIGRSLHVSDLVIPNAEILTDTALTVCTVSAPRAEEVAAPVEAVAEGAAPTTEPEVIKKGKTEDEAAEE